MRSSTISQAYYFLLFTHGIGIVAGDSLRGRAVDIDTDNALDEERKLIIGGNVAIPGDYPYFVHFDGIACGGTLIAPDIVLTAGHVS
ncbi:MAG: hypothetical protein ACI8RD_002585 [Bacillariaceae sp.]|jgi:hypothetical protein